MMSIFKVNVAKRPLECLVANVPQMQTEATPSAAVSQAVRPSVRQSVNVLAEVVFLALGRPSSAAIQLSNCFVYFK